MSAHLFIIDKHGKERYIPVEDNVILGRVKENEWEVVVRKNGRIIGLGVEDATVSKSHAQIWQSMGSLWIKDLGSLNGTYVDGMVLRGWKKGERQESAEVNIFPGMNIRLGSATHLKVVKDKDSITVREDEQMILPWPICEKFKINGVEVGRISDDTGYVRMAKASPGTYQIEKRTVDIVPEKEAEKIKLSNFSEHVSKTMRALLDFKMYKGSTHYGRFTGMLLSLIKNFKKPIDDIDTLSYDKLRQNMEDLEKFGEGKRIRENLIEEISKILSKIEVFIGEKK